MTPADNTVSHSLMAIADRYVRALRKRFPDTLTFALVFGSVARGEAKSDSDIDLLLVFTELPKSRLARRRFLEPEPKEIEQSILALMDKQIYTRLNPMVKTTDEVRHPTPFLFSALRDGVVLFDRSRLHRSLKQEIDKWQSALGARFQKIGNVDYIELKPNVRWGEVFSI